MKNLFISICFFSCTQFIWGQISNPELAALTNACPPTNWSQVGVTGCRLIDIAPGWNFSGTPFVLPPSTIAPNANPGDRVWITFQNTLGQFGGFTQAAGPLDIGNSYCMEFNATVNRIFNPTATLAVNLEIDNIVEDSHTFTLGDPIQTVTLCFTATATTQQITLRTD